jgi:hypothetical protein
MIFFGIGTDMTPGDKAGTKRRTLDDMRKLSESINKPGD